MMLAAHQKALPLLAQCSRKRLRLEAAHQQIGIGNELSYCRSEKQTWASGPKMETRPRLSAAWLLEHRIASRQILEMALRRLCHAGACGTSMRDARAEGLLLF